MGQFFRKDFFDPYIFRFFFFFFGEIFRSESQSMGPAEQKVHWLWKEVTTFSGFLSDFC